MSRKIVFEIKRSRLVSVARSYNIQTSNALKSKECAEIQSSIMAEILSPLNAMYKRTCTINRSRSQNHTKLSHKIAFNSRLQSCIILRIFTKVRVSGGGGGAILRTKVRGRGDKVNFIRTFAVGANNSKIK